MKHYGDITKIKGDQVEIVDVICGGSPCQDLSVAGKRAGMKHAELGDGETTRSGLFMEQLRIIREQHNECKRTNKPIRPRFMVWENVPGALSSNDGDDFRAVLEETARIADSNAAIPRLEDGQSWSNAGCILGDNWSIAWRIHDAQFWGVPQRRRRIALVADFRGQTAPEILFERESLSGNIEQSGQTGQGIAADTSGSTGAISFQERAGCDGGVKESLSKTNGPEHSQPSTINQSVAFSQDAYDEYTETDSSATIKQSGGVYGGGSECLVTQ